MIRIRVDDFPQTKGEPKHTLAAFREFNRILSFGTGVRYLLGVIPLRSTVDDLLFLARETDCVIGLHGTDHDESRLDRNGGNQFEPYLSRVDVARHIREARISLEAAISRPVLVYMPPRNVISMRDVAALGTDTGIKWFTTGPETDEWARNHPCAIHSEKPHEYGRSDELLQAGSHLKLIEACEAGRDVVLTLHWTWEVNIGLEHLQAFLEKIPKKYFRDFDGENSQHPY